MTNDLSRRAVLLGIGAGALAAPAAGALERSPLPRPRPNGGVAKPLVRASRAEALIEAAGLSGSVTYAVADAETGALLDAGRAAALMPPASTAKAITALYALDRLGPDYRFDTTLVATGPLVDGRIEGDLVLMGSGDPVLDSDALGALASDLKAAGVVEVAGQFLVYAGALPFIDRISGEQPETAGYDPTITGLNLNFNRVHFEWKRDKTEYDFTLQARARRFRPDVTVATMDIVDERLPVFTYRQENGLDRWTVARHALGKDGARWLPIRRPVAYAAEAFHAVAEFHGIALKPGVVTPTLPEGQVLARHRSPQMVEIMRGMLRYSTNLTAEVAGMTASGVTGAAPLNRSAAEMNGWTQRAFGCGRTYLRDHSGLSYGSRMTAGDMVKILAAAEAGGQLHPLLRPVNLGEDTRGATVVAKTGTHNFVSALAGYLDQKSGRRLAFAIFCGDPDRRDAVPKPQRERPRGARTYANVARRLQKDMLRNWAGLA